MSSARQVTDRDAAVLSELSYINFDADIGEVEPTIHDVFYNQNGEIRQEIRQRAKTDSALSDTLANIEKRPEHYRETLQNYTLTTTSAVRNPDSVNSGYYGVAVTHIKSKETVIVHRGTDSFTGMDSVNGIGIATGVEAMSKQTDDAIGFSSSVIESQVSEGGEKPVVTHTGQSLGGGLAETAAVITNHKAETKVVTYNGLSGKNIVESKIENASAEDRALYEKSQRYIAETGKAFSNPNDPIERFNPEHISQTIPLANPDGTSLGAMINHKISTTAYMQYDSNGNLIPKKLNTELVDREANAIYENVERIDNRIAEIMKTLSKSTHIVNGALISDQPELLGEYHDLLEKKETLMGELSNLNHFASSMDNYTDTELSESYEIMFSDIVYDIFDQWITSQYAIYFEVAEFFRNAANVIIGSDPIVLDLDGDGIETIAADQGILFDHDGDGVKHGTGWVGKDDGLLVRDLNQNGNIDDDSELFGENTLKSDGSKAQDGFDALADLDTNQDGKIDAEDEAFETLKIWQDHNQNALVDEGEISNLADQVDELDLNAKVIREDTAAGIIAKESTFKNTAGDENALGSLDFDTNRFYREFTTDFDHQFEDEIAQFDSLPFNMKGSGAIRDLSQAVLINPEIFAIIDKIESESNYLQKKEYIEQLVYAWSEVSEGFESAVSELDGKSFNNGASVSFDLSDDMQGFLDKLQVLERFNHGRLFDYSVTEGLNRSVLHVNCGIFQSVIALENNQSHVLNDSNIMIVLAQKVWLERSYNALIESVEEAIYRQGEYQSHIQHLQLKRDPSGNIVVDFSGLESHFASEIAHNPEKAVEALLAIDNDKKGILNELGFDAKSTLVDILKGASFEVKEAVSQHGAYHFYGGSFSGFSFDQGILHANDPTFEIIIGNKEAVDAEHFIAAKGNQSFIVTGNADNTIEINGNDTLLTGDGDDQIIVKAPEGAKDSFKRNDILGGKGNDEIISADNTSSQYIYRSGDGRDSIFAGHTTSDHQDYLQIQGVSKEDVILQKEGSDLVLSFENNPLDQITIEQFYTKNYKLKTFYFDEHEYRSNDEIFQLPTLGTSEADNIIATELQEMVYAFEGDDVIYTYDAGDVIYGGDGNDQIYVYGKSVTGSKVYGDEGDDTIDTKRAGQWKFYYRPDGFELFGGEGNDTLLASQGDDYLQGGEGNDYLNGFQGSDVIYGGEGDDILDGGVYGNDKLYGGDGNDIILAGAAPKAVYDQDMWFERQPQYLNQFHTFVTGGRGDDQIISGSHNKNTYYYSRGDGHDTILKNANVFSTSRDLYAAGISANVDDHIAPRTSPLDLYEDTLVFLSGIKPEDVTVTRFDYDLMLSLSDTESITVKGFYYEDKYTYPDHYMVEDSDLLKRAKLNTVQFSDGTIWQREDGVLNPAPFSYHYHGTEGNDVYSGGIANDTLIGLGGDDTLTGNEGDDYLQGGAGNDELSGGDGNDVLDGGTGDNRLYGGKGDDAIYIGSGKNIATGESGHNTFFLTEAKFDSVIYGAFTSKSLWGGSDTIIFSDQTTFSDLDFIRYQDDLRIKDNYHQSELVIDNFFYERNGEAVSHYYEFSFADGRVLDHTHQLLTPFHIQSNMKEVHGSDKNEVIRLFYQGESTAFAGAGDDSLFGNDYDNELFGGAGSDILVGKKGHNTLFGGEGADRYIVASGEYTNIMADARNDEDTLQLNALSLSALHILTSDSHLYLAEYDETGYEMTKVTLEGYFQGQSVDKLLMAGHEYSLSSLIDSHYNVIDMNEAVHYQGSNKDDVLYSFDGDDQIDVKGGDNYLSIGNGDDVIQAKGGDNVIEGKDGNKQISLGKGNNDIQLGDGDNIISTRSGDDFVTLGNGDNTLHTRGGDDEIILGSGNNIIYSGAGDDVVEIAGGNNQLYTAKGDDEVYIEGGENEIRLGRGSDMLTMDGGTNLVYGGMGDDYIEGYGQGTYRIYAGHGDDEIILEEGEYHIYLGQGDDMLTTDYGSKVIVYTGKGDDEIYLSDGDDCIYTQGGSNLIYSGAGNDILKARKEGQDQFHGEEGDDRLVANGSDQLYGGEGNDKLIAKKGEENYLQGGEGDDFYRVDMKNATNTVIDNRSDSDDEDWLHLDGMSAESLYFYRDLGHLVIKSLGDEYDLTVENYFENDASKLDTISTEDALIEQKELYYLLQAMEQFRSEDGVYDIQNKESQSAFDEVITSHWQFKDQM